MVILQNDKLTPIVYGRLFDAHSNCSSIDQSLHMNLYRVYNLPMLHPTLHVHVQYKIESMYLATVMGWNVYNITNCIDVKLCLMTNGHLCMFKQALYPVEHPNWCIYALFINDEKQIKRKLFS